MEGVRDVYDWRAYILSWFSSQANERRDFHLSRKVYQGSSQEVNMDECKPIKTPMPSKGHLDLDKGGKSVDQTVYRSIIGSLLYLTAYRPDIMFSVCMCARFLANPKEAHMVAIKRILRYLKHTPSIGLWYPKGARFQLVGYSDSDYAGCKLVEKAHPEGAICWVDH